MTLSISFIFRLLKLVGAIKLYLSVGVNLSNSARINTHDSPINPMKVVKILSDTGIDCIQANIKIVIPPTPNITFNNMAKPSSLMVLPPFLLLITCSDPFC